MQITVKGMSAASANAKAKRKRLCLLGVADVADVYDPLIK